MELCQRQSSAKQGAKGLSTLQHKHSASEVTRVGEAPRPKTECPGQARGMDVKPQKGVDVPYFTALLYERVKPHVSRLVLLDVIVK